MLALLLACATPAPAPAAYAPDLSAYAGAEASCLQARCADAADADAFGACRADRCGHTAAVWTVNPTLLRYDAGTVTMSVAVGVTPGLYGDVPEPTPGETWLGATVLTTKGEEIDMAVHTVFPDRLGEPFTFSSEVGPDVDVVIVGLWGKKIEPCDSTRSGCQMFGFVLDQSLAAFPAETYVATPPRRQRFLPGVMSLQVVTPPALPPAEMGAISDAVKAFAAAEGERFGTKLDPVYTVHARPESAEGGAPAAPADSVVVHKHVHDGPFASRLAAALDPLASGDVSVRHEPDAAVDLDVRLGADTCPPGTTCR